MKGVAGELRASGVQPAEGQGLSGLRLQDRQMARQTLPPDSGPAAPPFHHGIPPQPLSGAGVGEGRLGSHIHTQASIYRDT